MNEAAGGVADLRPLARAREQRAWYWYDWANSAYTTTIGTVFFGPYFINLAENAVGEEGRFDVAMFSLPPGALFFWLITLSTILSAVLLPPLGAFADRTENKKGLLGVFAWTGAAFASLIFFATGDNWQLAAVGIVVGQRLLRRCRSHQRLDPPADLDRGRARPRLLAGLGVRLPRRRAAAGRSTSPSTSAVMRSASTRGSPPGCACSRRHCGGQGSRSSRSCGSRTTRRSTSSPRPGALSGRASDSCSPRSRTCAATPWP